jgi:hypothetical protein
LSVNPTIFSEMAKRKTAMTQDKSPREDMDGELPASAANTTNWQAAFAQRSASAFGSAFVFNQAEPLDAANQMKPPIIRQVKDVLRRARKLPVGPARNDLRQLAQGLLSLHRRGGKANVRFVSEDDEQRRSIEYQQADHSHP